VTKSQRQHRITQVLDSEVVSTAAQLVAILERDGIGATQATVTRDLQELGAVKMRDGRGVRRLTLAATGQPGPAPEDHLRRMLAEWAISVESSGSIVVIRTPPGCAHVVASALDRGVVGGMIGTVAGDDTILVVATAASGGPALARDLRERAGLTAGKRKRR
jgi:transcriptional regulator of arginine metabolism